MMSAAAQPVVKSHLCALINGTLYLMLNGIAQERNQGQKQEGSPGGDKGRIVYTASGLNLSQTRWEVEAGGSGLPPPPVPVGGGTEGSTTSPPVDLPYQTGNCPAWCSLDSIVRYAAEKLNKTFADTVSGTTEASLAWSEEGFPNGASGSGDSWQQPDTGASGGVRGTGVTSTTQPSSSQLASFLLNHGHLDLPLEAGLGATLPPVGGGGPALTCPPPPPPTLPEDMTFTEEKFMSVIVYCCIFFVAAIGNLTVFITLFRNR